MIPTRDSMRAMERHFFGALVAPARTWLDELADAHLAFSGTVVRATREGCAFDFGRVESPAEERRTVRVFNPGWEDAVVRLAEHPAWLSLRWTGTGGDAVPIPARSAGVPLQLTIEHDADAELRGTIRFAVERRGMESDEAVTVRIVARHSRPIAQLDFNGSPVPRAFDFGKTDKPYVLSIGNRSAVPLIVRFADLPAWLVFEVDGRRRGGPVAGRFFERAAPFTVQLRPQFLGRQDAVLRIETNDPRRELQTIELPLSANVVATKPCVRAFAPPPATVRTGRSVTVQARLENWGSPAAMTRIGALPKALHVTPPVVPPAHDAGPGRAQLPIRITPAQLGQGQHRLAIVLAIDGGDPAEVKVPVLIDVTARTRGPRVPPEMVAAVVTLLLLTLLFVFVARGMP